MDAVDELVAALSAHDVEAFVACYAADARIDDADGSSLAAGRDAIRERYAALFRQYPAFRVRALTRLASGDFVVQEEEVTGRSERPERHIAVYRIADGVVAHERLLR